MKIIYLIIVATISSFFLISCSNQSIKNNQTIPITKQDKSIPTTTNLLGAGALIAFGFNQLTGEPVAVNTINGDPVEPCSTNTKDSYDLVDKDRYQNKEKLDQKQLCNFRIINNDGEFSLIDHLGNPVQNVIFKKVVYALFEGSHCVHSEVVGGVEYTGCYSTAQVCNALKGDGDAKNKWREFYEAKC